MARSAHEEDHEAGETLLRQNDAADSTFFLVSGSVQILMRVGFEDLLFAILRAPGELIGWSTFRPPYRYTASVRCEASSIVIRIPRAAFEDLFERDARLHHAVLCRVAQSVTERFEGARALLHSPPGRASIEEIHA